MKEYVVYKATNTVNGNFYLGAASNGMLSRKKAHFWDAISGNSGCKVFHSAIRKYGKEAFVWEVIATLNSFEEMMAKEVELIAELKPQYNMTKGGEGIIGLPRTKEWYAKVSKTLKAKGIKPPGVTDWSHNHKSVVCLNDRNFFESVKAASSYYGFEIDFSGGRICTKGKFFILSKIPMLKEDCDKKIVELNAHLFSRSALKSKARWRSVVCINDNKEFKSLADAERFYKISSVSIRNSCIDGALVGKGLKFRYAECAEVFRPFHTAEGKSVYRENVRRAAVKRGKENGKAVFALETGEYFNSINDAAKQFGIDHSIYYYTEVGRREPKSGLTFKRVHV